MIRCTPRSLCSWDYDLNGEGHQAVVEFNWGSEQGMIRAGGKHFDVCKQGVMSGHWTLEHSGVRVASGIKTSVFTRGFEIESPMGSLELLAQSAFSRSFALERAGRTIAVIEPAHAFTKRATIETAERDCDFPTLAFAFWLTAINWRRAASNN